MLSPDRIQNPMPLAAAAADYDVVRRAIGHIRGHWREQPEIDAIAEAAGVTPTELHHLFRRWAGLTPKAFLQALTLDGARQLLRDSASVLDATYEVGLSGPGLPGAIDVERARRIIEELRKRFGDMGRSQEELDYIERLFLVSRGRRLPIAAFLGPAEKASFAHALGKALGEAKRGPTRTVLD